MEQKQLDEIEESFYSEEFVDEEEAIVGSGDKSQDEKIAPLKKAEKKKASKGKIDEDVLVEQVKKEIVKEGKKEISKATQDDIVIVPPEEIIVEEVKKEEPKKVQAKSTSSKEKGRETQTGSFWRTTAAALLILLVVSIATGGFTNNQEQKESGLSVSEAKARAENFVNTQLVPAPMKGELKDARSQGDLYRFTFAIGKEKAEYYMTKDGLLFFPIALKVKESAPTQEQILEAPQKKEETKQPKASAGKTISLKAKKWSFTPDNIEVTAGETVTLSIMPDTENPTFSINDFTFAIPGLNVEQKVSGKTEITFKAEKKGTFEFMCGNCEEWRGMTGSITIK